MGFGTLVVRVVLVTVVPCLVYVIGNDPGPAVALISAIAAIFECLVTGLDAASTNNIKGGRRGKSSMRPLKSFPLQLGVIYVVQLWFLLLRAGASTEATSPLPSAAVVPHAAVAQAANPLPPLPAVGHQGDASAAGPQVSIAPVAPLPAAAANGQPPPIGPNGFQLDAPPEALRWTPKTISVVLPCAEERDLALKTVQAVYKTTPADVLHEIVVVDDGSNPPLSSTHLQPDVQRQYKVMIKRHEDTIGLIGAKKTGGDAASGDIVVFFDCHVGPQPGWHEDFLRLISENYRRMVIPQITALDIDTWTQIGGGGGMSKCYVTWDGDFKWGGTDDEYMGMLSGGLAGLSKRWWDESGGYDSEMLGWGGENIDQGIRMWVCGGEIVAAPNAQVAHMWRTGSAKTGARYKHVGDTAKNRARAMHAWMGEFKQKLDDFPMFQSRKSMGGDQWYGDMNNFQKVKDRLAGCHPFAWYLKRFKTVYEDAGLLPKDIFMIREESSGLCLRFQGQAGTSGSGREGVVLEPCDAGNHRFFWHPGNRSPKTEKCCSGLRAWNTEQCLEGGQGGGKAITGICEVGGRNSGQHWRLHSDGKLRRGDTCLGPGDAKGTLKEAPCFAFRSSGGATFTKQSAHEPLETTLYNKAQREHPEIFAKLNSMFKAKNGGPRRCQEPGVKCGTLMIADGSKRCLDDEAHFTNEMENCAMIAVGGSSKAIRHAESGDCVDSASDQDPETWVFYGCHGGGNQDFNENAGRWCSTEQAGGRDQCFDFLSA